MAMELTHLRTSWFCTQRLSPTPSNNGGVQAGPVTCHAKRVKLCRGGSCLIVLLKTQDNSEHALLEGLMHFIVSCHYK